MRTIAALGALSTLALIACGGERAVGEAGSPIIGGTKDTGDPAIVMLVSIPPDQSTFDTCTASVIAPSVLLTAAHCIDPATHAGWTFGAFVGPDASAYDTAASIAPKLVPVASAHAHPDYDPAPPFHADIGVVVLDQDVAVAPLPMNRAPLDDTIVGKPARIVGYGQLVYNTYNAVKHEADTVVAALDPGDTIKAGDVQRRGCIGDSGGPVLLTINGVEVIAGVDSYTDTTGCLEPAHYRRTDLYTAFLDEHAPPPSSSSSSSSGGGGEGGGGGGETSTGGCAVGGGQSPYGVWLAALALLVGVARGRKRVIS